ncbi:hypothetical protein N7478_004446 [Penicillium angulare]|uniref:uncharacterized protein n=1 Tax=Penicillium angulare TaxID=116970 RepID=UPI0025410D45|nr:uncharacterized protein N7478_004446 [Penicillium angulare]KAJ5279074.1 hypothetical protein N7478_004446 [Penicillium angulare]
MVTVNGAVTLTGGFNFTETVDEIGDDILNITSQAFDQIEDYVKDVVKDIATLDIEDIPAWPTLDLDLNLDNTTGLPGAEVHFEFDNLELYLDLDIKLSAGSTYTLNIYSSESPAGIAMPGLTVGAVFSVDLILIAEAEIDIGSGIHIKLEDGLAFDLEMFNSNVSKISLPGGMYEFLPVTIEGEGSIQALLSLKASLGIEVSSNSIEDVLTFSGGIEADVFSYVADFLLQVNGSSSTSGEEDGCELAAVAEYTMAVGAAAGATVAVDTYVWGPSPNTTVPVFYTTLASICAGAKTTSTSTASAQITARAELDRVNDYSTTAMTSTESFTIVNCISSGLINCPINLQNTTSYQRVVTSDFTIQSGSTVTTSPTALSTVSSAIEFGTNARRLLATSGSPTSYIPTSHATSTGSGSGDGGGSIVDGKTDGTSNKLIIGLTVGLGVPFLAALLIGLGWYIRKRNKNPSNHSEQQALQQGSPDTSYDSPNESALMKHSPQQGE